VPAASKPLLSVRPRIVRTLTVILAPATTLAFAALSIYLETIGWRSWHVFDIVWMNYLGLAFGLIIWRLGAIRVRAYPDGLHVRNLFSSRTVPWTAIVGVHMHPAGTSPWAVLDLGDGTTFALHAIQVSEGERAQEACRELRRLVDVHGRP
jgi:hypothetical protein